MSEVNGFKLVPASMHLDRETIEAINFHCGYGADGQFGEYSHGLLWVGVVTDDEGKEVYGLHLATAEYPEEGSTTLVEFNAPEDAAQSELAALREELAEIKESLAYRGSLLGRTEQRLTAAEQRNAELQKQLDSIDRHLRGNVNDPDPLPPIMPGAVSYTTTYGLVAGLRRERDYLKKSATPLPAGDDYFRQLAQRLREYVGNPHHIDPLSEAFKRLIDDSALALSKLAALKPTESGASEPCAHSHANKIGCPECGEEFKRG